MIGGWPPLCRVVAAHSLPTAGPDRSVDSVDAPTWAHLVSCVVHERIPGLLTMAIADGAIPASAEQADEAGRALQASMITAIRLERALGAAASVLDNAGVALRVLKGPAVAHLDYPDASLRSFGDIDLLVPPGQFDRAVLSLSEGGYRRRYPEPRPGFDSRFGKGSCLVGPDGYEIDLHRSFAMGPFGLALRVEDLWRTSSTFRVGGREFAALGPAERFLHACYHAALGSPIPRLSALRDVAQMQLYRPLDLDRVLELTAAWRAEAVVIRAVELTWAVLGLDAPTPLTSRLSAYRPSRRDRRALRVYTEPGPTYAAKSFAAVREVPGPFRKAAFLLSLAFPRRAYLDERRERRGQRWGRGLRQIVRSRR